jgi:hypothetical protein
MRTMRIVTAVVCLGLGGCSGQGIDEVIEEVGSTEQEIAGGGCAITPRTSQERWYCLSVSDQQTKVYFRFDNNGALPWRGEGPYSGTYTRYNEPYPYRTTGSYSMQAVQAINGCQGQTDGFTEWRLTLNGQVCYAYAWWRNFPFPKAFSFSCPGDHEFFCWEHNGPRGFGGGGN